MTEEQELLFQDSQCRELLQAIEAPYIERCLKALTPKGHVLIVGFGLGYSARLIYEKYRPKTLTIVEKDPLSLRNAKEWAKSHLKVKVIEGDFEKALPDLKTFDEIFFDDKPVVQPLILKKIGEKKSLSQKLALLKKMLKEESSLLKVSTFSDKKLTKLEEDLKSQEEMPQDEFLSFLNFLEQQDCITLKQKRQALGRMGLSLPPTREEMAQAERLLADKIEDAKQVTTSISAQLKQCKEIKFSNKDVERFASEYLERPGVKISDVLHFVDILVEKGNLSTTQRDLFLKKVKKIKDKEKKEKEVVEKTQQELQEKLDNRITETQNLKGEFEKEMLRLKSLKISESQLNKFLEEIERKNYLGRQDIAIFMHNLEAQEIISSEQKLFFLKRVEELQQNKLKALRGPLFHFLPDLLKTHMKSGSKLIALWQSQSPGVLQQFTSEMEKHADIEMHLGASFIGLRPCILIYIQKE